MTPSTVKLPAWPEQVAHVQSNGDFCADRQITSTGWPVNLFTEEQMEAFATSAVLEDRRAREGVEMDAARYRWLVAHASPQYLAAVAWGAAEASLAHADPDAAIDAALSSTAGGKDA